MVNAARVLAKVKGSPRAAALRMNISGSINGEEI